VYVACDGKLTAYEAKTLKKLGEATFWKPPTPPEPPTDRPKDRGRD
jgi:hypothetical protein